MIITLFLAPSRLQKRLQTNESLNNYCILCNYVPSKKYMSIEFIQWLCDPHGKLLSTQFEEGRSVMLEEDRRSVLAEFQASMMVH